MGWTPTGRKGETGVAQGRATPAPRRRRKAAVEPQVEPQVEPKVTGHRPPAGKKNTALEQVDTRKRPTLTTMRPGKRWSQIMVDIKAGEYTWAQFVEGLDEEELARGQLRADNGTFVGRPPILVPREFHLACQREMKKRFELIFSKEVLGIAEEYLKMAQSKDLKPETRAKMLQYAMERVFGPVPKELKVSQEAPWEQMVINVMRTDGAELPAHHAERYNRYLERQGGGAMEGSEG